MTLTMTMTMTMTMTITMTKTMTTAMTMTMTMTKLGCQGTVSFPAIGVGREAATLSGAAVCSKKLATAKPTSSGTTQEALRPSECHTQPVGGSQTVEVSPIQ